MNKIELIDLAIAAEKEKIYSLKNSAVPGLELGIIIHQVMYLQKLRFDIMMKNEA